MVSVKLSNQYTMQEGGISINNSKRPRSASSTLPPDTAEDEGAGSNGRKQKKKAEDEVRNVSCPDP